MDGCNQMPNAYARNQPEEVADLKRGPWTMEEDILLVNYINAHGEGRWNSLAQSAGLKRTGKSCRLRWLNYLRPDVRRGNMTPEEQLLILELHSRWGNRWSKIAQYLPGRTDNEIKNYWRTRVQKQAKQMKCDVNSQQFRDAVRYLWMPRLMERIHAARLASADLQQRHEASDLSGSIPHNNSNYQTSSSSSSASSSIHDIEPLPVRRLEFQTNRPPMGECSYSDSASAISDTGNYHCLRELGPTTTSELRTPVDLSDCSQANSYGLLNEGCLNSEMSLPAELSCWDTNNYGGDLNENMWSSEDFWFLQQQLCDVI